MKLTNFIRPSAIAACLLPLACNTADSGAGGDAPPKSGLAILGQNTHSVDNVALDVVGTREDGLRKPRDLGFNPEGDGELWVVNRQDDSTVTYSRIGTEEQTAWRRKDGYALHFMEESAGIAFGAPGTFGTCGETRNTYNHQADPDDFMGPALWSTDPDIYAVENPIGLGSHLDMLHEGPLCMGIAWEKDNVYWTFVGLFGAIVRFDFQQDHGPGYDDHSDGIIDRYVEGQVAMVENVPSHMELDRSTGLLYIADTGNKRIAVLDTKTGTRAEKLSTMERGTQHWAVDDATITTLVSSEQGEFQKPSGLALHDGLVWVADNETSRISAFKLDGTRVDWLDTGLPAGSLMGIEFGPDGKLFMVDNVGNRVLRLSAKAE